MMRHLIALAVFASLGTAIATAQPGTATLTGTVTDTSGAVVPAAKVVVKHESSGLTRSSETSAVGRYVVPMLPPGTYTVRADAKGFNTAEVRDVVLQTGDRLALDIAVVVAGVAESVTVSADAGQIQLKSESGERSEVITTRQVRDIALNGRNLFDFMKLVPGVVSTFNGQVMSDAGVASFNINGTRGSQKDVTIDGASNLLSGANQRVQSTINPDAVMEVRVLTSNFQAEYGRAGGGHVQYTTRSGTQSFRGSGRYFRRHDSLNANSFFNNTQGVTRSLYRYNYYGFDIGGPVILPGVKFNRSRDKLFFFFNQEYYRQGALPSSLRNVMVPTERERAGDFSQTVDANGNPILIRDPLSSSPCNTSNRAGCFPNNVIPPTRIFVEGSKLLGIYPLPNDTTGGSRYNYSSQLSSSSPRREDILRVDFSATEVTRLWARIVRNHDDLRQPYGGSGNTSFNFPLSMIQREQAPVNAAVAVGHTFSPHLTGEILAAYSRGTNSYRDLDHNLKRKTYGVNLPLLYDTDEARTYLPQAVFGGIANVTFASASFLPLPRENNSWVQQLSGSLTKITSSHTIKTGLFYLRNRFTIDIAPISNGRITFNHDTNNPLNTNHPWSNALLGIYSQFEQSTGSQRARLFFYNLEAYIQDTWKVNRRLTLDFGLRISHVPPEYDTRQQNNVFVPDLYDPNKAVRLYRPVMVGGQRRAVDPAYTGDITLTSTGPAALVGRIVPGSGDLTNGIAETAQGYPRGGFEGAGAQWGPRFGFAWNVTNDSRTVVRGGFGISYDRVQSNVVLGQLNSPPQVVQPVLFYGRLSELPGAQGFRGPIDVTAYPRQGLVPNVYSYSLNLQRNFGWGTVVDVAYVGTLSRHLAQSRNINSVPYFTTFRAAAQDASQYPNNLVPSEEPSLPDVYKSAGYLFSGARALAVDFLRPYQGYANIDMREFVGSSNYHSLQVSATRRLSSTFTFGLAYTWSKSLDTASADFGSNHPYQTRAYDYSLSSFDRTHVLVGNYVYNLPKFSAQLWSNRIGKAVFDGWQVSGITQWYTGTPAEMAMTIQGVNTGQRILGTYSIAPLFYRQGSAPASTGALELNPDAYYVPAIGDIGPYPRNYLRNPGFVNTDLSVFKNFAWGGEGRYLQLRLEMFNAFNHTQFSNVNRTTQLTTADNRIGTAVFSSYPNLAITNNLRPAGSSLRLGQYFGEYNATRDPRIIQIAAKFYF